jgi:glycosyltransferase involved in cell wall biosynthesis
VRLLARELNRGREMEEHLVTRRGSELARRVREDGVPVREVPWGPGLDPRALWHLCRAIRDFKPTILHAHDSHALQLSSWARRLARSNAKLVATRRVDFHLRPRSVWFRVDRIIAISEAVRGIVVADGVAPQTIAVVPSGIDADEVRRAAATPLDIRARLALPRETRLALNVAALVPHKDQRTLIRAAQATRMLAPALHWLIAGEGELRGDLEAEIARLGLADRVHLLGYVPEADALIREADVLVMSSREEGLGSVVLHALALGTPVVATRGGGLPEIVPAEWLVPVGDADALARRVLAALTNPSTFSLAMARGVLAVYHSLA